MRQGADKSQQHDNRFCAPALKKAGIGKIRFHDLRHTKVSLMIDQDENIKYIQAQMGHSSPTETLNVYVHPMKPFNQESAKRFANTILNPAGHKWLKNKIWSQHKKGLTDNHICKPLIFMVGASRLELLTSTVSG